MGLQVGELFVNLGIKSADKSVGAITGVHKGLKETASMGLEAKAAIVGAVYAFQRLMSASGQRGTDLTNFNAILGVSAKTLQQYQFAARQVGVSNDEVEGSFKSLQAAMTRTLMGQGAPAGMRNLAAMTGGITTADIDRFAKSPQLLLERLQQYAQKESNVGLRNEVLKSFGIGDNMVAALSRNAFRPDVMARAPTYSDGELKSLDRANIAWGNLGNKIEMAMGHFNAKHGGTLVADLSKATDKALTLADAFMKLSEKAHLFEWLNKAFEGWAKIFDGLTFTIETLNKLTSDDPTKKAAGKATIEEAPMAGVSFGAAIVSMLGEAVESVIGKSDSTVTPEQKKQYAETLRKLNGGGAVGKAPAAHTAGAATAAFHATTPAAAAPNMPTALAGGGTPPEVNVTQNLNFQHDGKDAKKTGDSTKEAVKRAFWATPSLSGGF